MIKNERQYPDHPHAGRAFRAHPAGSHGEVRGEPMRYIPSLRRPSWTRSAASWPTWRSSCANTRRSGRGSSRWRHCGGVADLPMLLIKARIAGGLTQRELADRMGLKEQQIQRYEATDYAAAKWSRIREVADVLSMELGGSIQSVETQR